jgi:geranylgeranyl diphosphate synthase type II
MSKLEYVRLISGIIAEELMKRIEQALETAVSKGVGKGCPPRLAAAAHHAVFPGGGRVRPRLCFAVAQACGENDPQVTDAAAVALELLHCASLVHDDLPCFDNAAVRRGQPTIHHAYDERIAILVGDALIVLAFEQLTWQTSHVPERLAALTRIMSRAVGMNHGIIGGQAWECEPKIELTDYHREKTAALFAAATEAGAAATGIDAEPWRGLGENLGLAYQVADDLRDVVSNPELLGKPIGQDRIHNRPSAVTDFGETGALKRLEECVQQAIHSIPDCAGARELEQLVRAEIQRLLPDHFGLLQL